MSALTSLSLVSSCTSATSCSSTSNSTAPASTTSNNTGQTLILASLFCCQSLLAHWSMPPPPLAAGPLLAGGGGDPHARAAMVSRPCLRAPPPDTQQLCRAMSRIPPMGRMEETIGSEIGGGGMGSQRKPAPEDNNLWNVGQQRRRAATQELGHLPIL